jgi:hypothetical protein
MGACALADGRRSSGWVSENALALIISGSGERVAESANGALDAAPLLHVEFLTGTP